MASSKIQDISSVVQAIQSDCLDVGLLPLEVQKAPSELVISRGHFTETRGYILRVVDQINTSYEATCYDACAVMIRRLVEILIIESFCYHKEESEIKDKDNNFLLLQDLINKTLSKTNWHLSRNTKSGLKRLKNVGDLSAHSRRYNAVRTDIDDIKGDLRVTSEELLYVAGLKR
ncbi:MAG: DUF4145 domain-containing protein [Sneathiella sp.]|nr:DUF4145 domain-containing protein [Sneathiella sp.]